MSNELIICNCGGNLKCEKNKDEMSCSSCGLSFGYESGILSMLSEPDDFYEGVYLSHVKYSPKSENAFRLIPLWLINSGFLWAVRKHVPYGSTVVELGCGSGVKFFGEKYKMYGCDVSFGSLLRLRGVYENLVQADATSRLPFKDNSVDAIVSSFFWEHITEQNKSLILSECKRILKPGGKVIFLYDVETQNPLIRHFKSSNLELYQELFINGDGHIGYHSPKENAKIFKASGLDVISQNGFEKTPFQSASTSAKLLAFGGRYKFFVKVMTWFDKKPFYYFYTAFLRLIDCSIGKTLPKSWARIELSILEKIE